MMWRPKPSYEAPAGFMFVVREDKDWFVPPEVARFRCRFTVARNTLCLAAASAMMYRGRTRQRWPYCGKHMYGRWVEEEKVMHWVLAKDDHPLSGEPKWQRAARQVGKALMDLCPAQRADVLEEAWREALPGKELPMAVRQGFDAMRKDCRKNRCPNHGRTGA